MNVTSIQTFQNFAWKLAEQCGAQFVSFFVSIILARLLMPEDYSVVSVISVLSSFCTVFIDGGLSQALIQKKNSDIKDFSTVLYASLCLSGILYVLLYIISPYIAQAYSDELIVPVIRVYSLCLIIGSFNNVQCAYISKNLLFKKYFFATIIGTIISAIVSIYMAYVGFGVWALVVQKLLNLIIDTTILFITSRFRPQLVFVSSRLRILWSYGIKVLGTSLLDMLYNTIRPLIIGVRFNIVEMAYYEKGKSYPDILNSTFSSALASVLFPVIASEQDDIQKVKIITQKFIKTTSFVIFPTLLGLAAISDKLIIWMLTDKWLGAVPYMRIFCINYMFMLLQTGNLQSINAIGRSDIVFKLAVIKKTINFMLLFIIIFVSPSPLWLAGLGIITSSIAFIINSYTNKKLLCYGIKDQIMDIIPNLILAVLMVGVVLLVGKINLSTRYVLFIQVVVGIITYILFSYITHNPNFYYCMNIMKNTLKKS